MSIDPVFQSSVLICILQENKSHLGYYFNYELLGAASNSCERSCPASDEFHVRAVDLNREFNIFLLNLALVFHFRPRGRHFCSILVSMGLLMFTFKPRSFTGIIPLPSCSGVRTNYFTLALLYIGNCLGLQMTIFKFIPTQFILIIICSQVESHLQESWSFSIH